MGHRHTSPGPRAESVELKCRAVGLFLYADIHDSSGVPTRLVTWCRFHYTGGGPKAHLCQESTGEEGGGMGLAGGWDHRLGAVGLRVHGVHIVFIGLMWFIASASAVQLCLFLYAAEGGWGGGAIRQVHEALDALLRQQQTLEATLRWLRALRL